MKKVKGLWFKLVRFADDDTKWFPKYGLRENGDGPYVRTVDRRRMSFDTVEDAARFASQHGEFLEYGALTTFLHGGR